jgi:hypothetical protein
MKKSVFLTFLIVISSISYSQNLVLNPDFETWNSITKPASWTHADNCLKDSLSVHTGKYSCRHAGGSSTSHLGQSIPVTPGKEYKFSIFYLTGVPTTGNGSRIWCYWKMNDGLTSITDPATDIVMRPSEYLKSDTWQQFLISVTAPVEAAFFYLEVRTNTNSLTYWDDFLFEESVVTHNKEITFLKPVIYPNPVSGILTINNISNVRHIEILNLSGTKVWSSKFIEDGSKIINISEMERGIYIIRFLCEGEVITRKFIKN